MLQRSICKSNILGAGSVCQANVCAYRSITSFNSLVKTRLSHTSIAVRSMPFTAMLSAPSLRKRFMLFSSFFNTGRTSLFHRSSMNKYLYTLPSIMPRFTFRYLSDIFKLGLSSVMQEKQYTLPEVTKHNNMHGTLSHEVVSTTSTRLQCTKDVYNDCKAVAVDKVQEINTAMENCFAYRDDNNRNEKVLNKHEEATGAKIKTKEEEEEADTYKSKSPDGNHRHKRKKGGSSGGQGSGNNKNDKNEKEEEDNTNNNNNSEDDPNNSEIERVWLPRMVKMVLTFALVTWFLHWLARPAGKATGWHSLEENTNTSSGDDSSKENNIKIRFIELYNQYAQFYTNEGKLYQGLVNTHETQEHISRILHRHSSETSNKESDNSSGSDVNHEGKNMIKGEDGSSNTMHDLQKATATFSSTTSSTTASSSSLVNIISQNTQLTENKSSTNNTNSSSEHVQEANASATDGGNAQESKMSHMIDSNNTNTHHKSQIPVIIKGDPLSLKALNAIGVVMWILPIILVPILSATVGRAVMMKMERVVARKGRGGGNGGIGGKGGLESQEMTFKVDRSCSTKFADVAALKEAKKEITEIVDFLKHPRRFTELGAKVPVGALLLGPPGTGKTLLAKAVAGESNVAFIPVCGSDFVELYVGMGALRIRNLFEVARKQRSIIYIDEIDAFGLKRQGRGFGEREEQEHTLNELLTQLDGFKTGKRGEVMVLASTNVSQDALDPALIRPGRFDRIIHIEAPVLSERVEIFKVHLNNLKLLPDNSVKSKFANSSVSEELNYDKCSTWSEKNETELNANDKRSQDADEAVKVQTVNIQLDETINAANKEVANNGDKNTKEYSKNNKDSSDTSNTCSNNDKSEKLENDKSDKDKTSKSNISSNVNDKSLESKTEANSNTINKTDEKEEHENTSTHSVVSHKATDKRSKLIDEYAERMSNLCPGFVGSDISNVCNEAAILAARENAPCVTLRHLEKSIDRVLAGVEHRSRALSEFEKKVVAYHEAGHAVAGWFLNRADPLMKVSIVPRGGSALGYAQYLPNENYLRTAHEIRDAIGMALGGRIAECIFFNHYSTGAADDLRKVREMAYQYVSSFAPRSVYPPLGSSATRLVRPFGSSKADELDVQAKALVDEIYQSTYALLVAHKDAMEKLAQHLLQHEVLTYDDLVKYLGSRSERESDRKERSMAVEGREGNDMLHPNTAV